MKKSLRRAVYAGSFDPPTMGHLWMIKEGVRLFDELVVAVSTNPDKAPRFPLARRVALLQEITRDIPRVTIASFEKIFLIDFARRRSAPFILRGLRNKDDYEFERAMRQINADLHPGITTVFLMPPRKFAEVSSSMVVGLVGTRGWRRAVGRYVPPTVIKELARLAARQARLSPTAL